MEPFGGSFATIWHSYVHPLVSENLVGPLFGTSLFSCLFVFVCLIYCLIVDLLLLILFYLYGLFLFIFLYLFVLGGGRGRKYLDFRLKKCLALVDDCWTEPQCHVRKDETTASLPGQPTESLAGLLAKVTYYHCGGRGNKVNISRKPADAVLMLLKHARVKAGKSRWLVEWPMKKPKVRNKQMTMILSELLPPQPGKNFDSGTSSKPKSAIPLKLRVKQGGVVFVVFFKSTCTSRFCPRKIPPWLFGTKPAGRHVPRHCALAARGPESGPAPPQRGAHLAKKSRRRWRKPATANTNTERTAVSRNGGSPLIGIFRGKSEGNPQYWASIRKSTHIQGRWV